VALVGVATALEQIESLRDALQQLRGAEQLDTRRGELDREREASRRRIRSRTAGESAMSARTACARSTNSATAS
jgi:hypothetical protein